MNVVDVVAAALAALAAYRGWRRGLLGQAFELGGGFIGLLLGVVAGPRLADLLTDRPGLEGALISLMVVFIGLSVGQTIGFVLGHRFGRMARAARLGHVDQGLGSGFGVLTVLIAFWLIGSMLVHGPSRAVARALRHSVVLDALASSLPPPPNVLAYIQQYLDTSGFPRVFAGLPRIGPPVDLPSGREARRAVRAADQSTVRVVIPACGGTQLGSGWVAAPGYVVTNAHVVAGGNGPTVQELNGSDLSGTVVLFDPRTDVAVIYAPGLGAPALELDTTGHDNGTGGATLGYPGHAGGELRAHRAAVRARYEARGFDIYGRRQVTREIYDLRSPVRQGDSGGPFVLPSGEVAGMVFAASSTDGDTGYALTGAEIADEVSEGTGRTEPVGTGSCTR